MKPCELAKWVVAALVALLLPASIQLAWLIIFAMRCLPIVLDEKEMK